jgi:aspartokinase-like uncharacterized kinase
MTERPLRVIKLGGSLLTRPKLAENLSRWRARLPKMRDIVITGGGRLAEAVREFDRAHGMDPSASHSLAIDAIALTTRMVASLVPASRIIDSLASLQNGNGDQGLDFLDVRHFLRREEPSQSGRRLPHSWAATSDSIAARIAEVYWADELVLLKSTLPDGCTDWETAAKKGFVDRHFPQAVQGVRSAYCVNLADPAEGIWQPLEILQS